MRTTVLLSLLLLGTAPAAAQEAFTIAQVLSSPFPTSLATAKTGAVAWVFNSRGVRNIWVADPPAYQARQLTGYTADDGQELSSLQFTPDGGAVVFVRGGAPNGRGELPNPGSDPAGVERAIWIVPSAGGAPRKLAVGAGPALSPGGREVAYLSAGAVWTVGLDSGATAKAIIRARGGQGSLRWSPDGSKLAFVSNRGSHSFVGVYDLATRSVRWMDPGVDQDAEPVWSPDGRYLAFGRIPADFTPRLFVAEREGEPWSIRVADVATGSAREVFRALPGRGSVYREIVGDQQFYWTADGYLIFPWERDGWTHLYAVPAAGGAARLLTPGDGEV